MKQDSKNKTKLNKQIMKYIFLLLFFLPISLFAQNIDNKPVNGRYVIQLDTAQYFIKRDTSNGVINISIIPTSSLIKDLESQLNSVSGELTSVQNQIDLLKETKKVLNRRQKELVVLIGKVRFKIKK